MKRIFFLIACFLLLGATANLIIAAACALYGPVRSHAWTNTTTPPSAEWADFGTPVKWTTTETITCVGYQYTREDTQSKITGGCEIMVHDPIHHGRAGWPLHAFYGSRDPNQPSIQPTLWKPPTAITPAPSRTITLVREFPLTPIWRGIAVNSSLFAGAFLILAIALKHLRRALRLRSGLCPHCKYPAGRSPVCTECGQPLPARVVPP